MMIYGRNIEFCGCDRGCEDGREAKEAEEQADESREMHVGRHYEKVLRSNWKWQHVMRWEKEGDKCLTCNLDRTLKRNINVFRDERKLDG